MELEKDGLETIHVSYGMLIGEVLGLIGGLVWGLDTNGFQSTI